MGFVKEFLVQHLPALGKYKRWVMAAKASSVSSKDSYSQYGEDKYIANELEKYDLKDAAYVDVGANHPMDISNTYLLYRKGYHGIIIEPNGELIDLFKKFRKRDIALMIGCSNTSGVLKFSISKTPVLSSFSNDRDNVNTYKEVYVPVMPLDTALKFMDLPLISFLSVDVEGLNVKVLEGATETIKKTFLLCVEFDSEEDRKKIVYILSEDFELQFSFHCNLIYRNKKLAVSIPLKKDFVIHS